MKKLFFATALLLASVFGAGAQKYIVDIVFSPDSSVAVCKPVVPKNASGKKAPKYEKIFLHDGETVQVISDPLDSMGFVKFMSYRDVHIKYAGNEYTTKARNLVLSGRASVIYFNL